MRPFFLWRTAMKAFLFILAVGVYFVFVRAAAMGFDILELYNHIGQPRFGIVNFTVFEISLMVLNFVALMAIAETYKKL